MADPLLIDLVDGVAAVDKPAGWVVHAARPDEMQDLRAWLSDNGMSGFEPVHRLDRDTSGVVLFAEDPAIRRQLSEWFGGSVVTKTYLALVQGRTHRKGVIRRALADARRSKPLPAVTRYSLLDVLGGFSLVRVRPQTGRRHQVRRHLQGIGHAVVGDTRYRPKRRRSIRAFPGRLWLHAHRIELPDERVFEAPLAAELETHLAALRVEP